MNAYLKAKYGYYECSECGVKYSYSEYFSKYSIKHILTRVVICKSCGAMLSEVPKRCYWSDWYKENNGCSEQIEIGGEIFCARQTTTRRQQLLTEGYYYNCECFKPLKE